MLGEQGLPINRKRMQRLMRQMGIAALGPKPRTTKPAPGHKVFPYLLRGLAAVEDAGVGMDAAAEVAFEAGRAPQRTRVTRRIVPEPLPLRELTRGFVRRSVVHFTLISAVSPKSPTRSTTPSA